MERNLYGGNVLGFYLFRYSSVMNSYLDVMLLVSNTCRQFEMVTNLAGLFRYTAYSAPTLLLAQIREYAD